MTTYVALLRGVNVGGKNKLPMVELAAIFREIGCADVATYIQSGNVVYRADPERAAGLSAAVSAAIQARFGFSTPVVTRSADELRAAVADNPFLATEDPGTLHLAFLADTPAPDRAARLDPARSPPDRFALVGRDVYLHLPTGVANTRITNAWLDSTLKTVSTVRNWRTVQALVQMSG